MNNEIITQIGTSHGSVENLVCTGYVITLNLVLAGFILEVLKRSGAGKSLRVGVATVFATWMLLLGWGIGGHHFFPDNISGTAFFVIIITVVAVVAAIMLFFPPIKRVLANTPQELLLLTQGLRVFFGAGFLIQAALGLLPLQFGISDGMTHVIAAFLALKAGLLFTKGGQNRFELWFANLFGLLDIVVVALGISFVLLDVMTPYHNMMYVVFFAAPLFMGLHLVSIVKLVQTSSEPAGSLRKWMDSGNKFIITGQSKTQSSCRSIRAR